MDFQHTFSQPAQRLSLGGLPSSSDNISSDDQSLFQGLSQIGIPFDAFNPFSLQDPFFSPQNDQQVSQSVQAQQPQQQQHQQQHQHQHMTSQPLQAPKSLSPESSSNDDTQMQYEHSGMGGQTANHMVGIASVETADTVTDGAHRSSEEKDLNSMPAQDKRKAQNRAAQRAFRERKMVHVQKLEDQVSKLKDASKGLQSDNERLKRELAALSTQNEILRATHVRPSMSNSQHMHQPQQLPRAASPTLGPQTFTPTEFVVATGGEATLPLQFDIYPNSRGRMLLAGAAWDLIQRDKRVQMGQVDLEEVCRKLKGRAICDGRGPAFREDEVRKILNDCSKKGMNDDLL